MTLMLVSGAGAVSVLGALILSFAGLDSTAGGPGRAGLIVAALAALLHLRGQWRVAHLPFLRPLPRLARRQSPE